MKLKCRTKTISKRHITTDQMKNSKRDGVAVKLITSSVLSALFLYFQSACPSSVIAGQTPLQLPATVNERLSAGMGQDLIVLFDDSDVEAESAVLRRNYGTHHNNDAIRAVKRTRYRSMKQSAFAGFSREEAEELRDFDQLPMSFVRIKSRSSLDRLRSDPRIRAVYQDLPVYPHTTYSLPFIGQPTTVAAGFSGSGTTVAVLDTGINYSLPAFGNCTAPGTPSSCRVAASVDVTGNNLTLNNDPKGHGTNVAGIVAAVAPGTRIAAINAFSGGTSSLSWILSGIDWAISNQSLYNIVALNMSLGDTTRYTSPCGNSATNPYVAAINNLRSSGILPVASSGNSGFTNGISSPACTPGVVSVGAVYDLAWRSSPDAAVPFTFSACSESSLAAVDKVPCFSNSASFLTMLAPGAFITAAGIQMAGTSQAAPHVAGAAAVLRSDYPLETLDQITARMTSGGVPATDGRNGLVKPRLNLYASFTPVSDLILTVRSTPAQLHEGELLTYSATVLNNGPFPASGVVLSDTIPAGALFVSASPACQSNGVEVTCSLGTLARGASTTVNIIFSVPYAGVIENSVRVQSATADPQIGNNVSSAAVSVTAIPAVPAASFWGLGVVSIALAGVAGTRSRSRRNQIGSYY
jgi:uncharacterized repeat protein (TIGR01451 family)